MSLLATGRGARGVFAVCALALAACGEEEQLPTPDTLIDSQPDAVTNEATAQFSFRPVGTANGFFCSVDGAEPTVCVPPLQVTLADGMHTFSVAAAFNANVDETPAMFAWRIDTAAPATRLVMGPPALDNNTSPEFVFEGDDAEGPVTFECSLDGAPATPCVSPLTLSSLLDGAHTFEITAIDAAGNRDTTPVSFAWTITTALPETEITVGPTAGSTTAANNIEFQFTSPDTLATFECSLDGATFAACTSPVTHNTLANGAHTFQVRAVAVAGVDPSPASRAWNVDAIAPVTSFGTTPS